MSTATEIDLPSSETSTASNFQSQLLHLIGEPFLFLARGYGGELILHFGEKVVGPIRKTKHGEFRYEHGTYSLHLRGSAWLIKSGVSQSILSDGLESDFVRLFGEPSNRTDAVECPIAPGAVPTAMQPFLYARPDVNGIGLRVELSDGSAVIVIPTPAEGDVPNEDEVTDWELKTPNFALEVGPGRRWQGKPVSVASE